MIAAKLLLAAVWLTPLAALDDCGASDQSHPSCVPNVAWIHPGAGTVVKVKKCPGFFGTEMHYILVDSGPRLEWMPDPTGTCRRGDDWVESVGC